MHGSSLRSLKFSLGFLPVLLLLVLLLSGGSCMENTQPPSGDDDTADDDDTVDDDDSAVVSPDDDDAVDDDDSGSDDDDDVCPPDPKRFDWYFSIHSGEVGYDFGQSALAFEQIAALGGTGVRTDVYWYDIEPEQGQWDENMLAFYDDYVSLALSMGIEPMMIVSNPPGWARDLYQSDPAAFWERYEIYVQRVVDRIGDRVTHYQIWNEANHVIDPIDSDDDWQLFQRGGSIVRASDPDAILYVNVMANLLGWEEAVTSWLDGGGEFIDVIGVDHYAGTWATVPYDDWGPLETLVERINNPLDPWYGKAGAVMETGYSSWAWAVADEEDQQEWIEQALPALRQRVEKANSGEGQGIWLGNYYQLIDVDTDGVGQEAHFGILHSDFQPKQGYDALQAEIATFDSL